MVCEIKIQRSHRDENSKSWLSDWSYLAEPAVFFASSEEEVEEWDDISQFNHFLFVICVCFLFFFYLFERPRTSSFSHFVWPCFETGYISTGSNEQESTTQATIHV